MDIYASSRRAGCERQLEIFDRTKNESKYSRMSAGDGGRRFQGFGTLCARAGAGDAIATKKKEDVGGVRVRIGLMEKELDERVS
jgi:hypothetical protein